MNGMPHIPAYLERLDPVQQMARFYSIRVEPTLFGDWAAVYRWGRIGTHGQRQEQWFTTWTAAMEAARAALDRKRRRGYRAPAEWPQARRAAAVVPKRPNKAIPTPAHRSQYELALD